MDSMSLPYACLAIQSAMLDIVSPELRAIVISLVDNVLYSRFYYEGEVDESLIDLWQCAITEATAHMGIDCFSDNEEIRLDYPEKIPVFGVFAYLRKEPDVLDIYGLRKTPNFLAQEEPLFVERGEEKLKSYGRIMLAGQRALLGVVTPELRSVIVDFDDQEIYVRFYYDGVASAELIREWEDAIMQIGIEMGMMLPLNGEVVRLDYPKEIPFRGRNIYKRKEE